LAAILGAYVKLQVQQEISKRLGSGDTERFSVAEIVNAIHKTLTPKLIELESFVTFLYARLDKTTGTLSVVCCGHPPLLVVNNGTCTKFGLPQLPLGVLVDEVYEKQLLDIGFGAAVVCYSDGLTDARNATGDIYGEERLLLELSRYPNAKWGANALEEKIYSSVLNFVGDQPLTDDLTLMVARIPDEVATPHRLVLSRQLSHIAELRKFVSDFAHDQQLGEELEVKITLVAVELFTNTIRHSSSGLINSSIEIQMRRLEDTVWFLMEALGPHFDPVRKPVAQTLPFDLTREGGFGLQIINAMTETINYSHAAGVNRTGFGFFVMPQ
jgi:sigma-B regulation protein RsbU (phosphoserine phosphatase)